MASWNRTMLLCVACLASVEAQAPATDSKTQREACDAEGREGGYDRSSQLDDLRLLASFALGFFVMHGAQRRWKKPKEEDPDGFGDFDFLEEDDAPLCQMAVVGL